MSKAHAEPIGDGSVAAVAPAVAEVAKVSAVDALRGADAPTAQQMLALQRTAGNASVARYLASMRATERAIHRGPPTAAPAPPAKSVVDSQPAAQPTTHVSISTASTVEDGKASVVKAMDRLTDQQVDAVTLMEQTAQVKDPAVQDIVGEIIKALVLGATDMALAGITKYVAKGITAAAARHGTGTMAETLKADSEIAKMMNDFVAAQLKAGATALWSRATAGEAAQAPGTTGLLLFFHYERAYLRAQGEDRVTEFNNQAVDLQELPDIKALNALQLLKEGIDQAADQEIVPGGSKTYFATMVHYANLLAETHKGRTTADQHAVGEQDAAAIGAGSARGVLNVRFNLATPQAPPKVTGASVDGLNEHLRPLLAKRRIGDLNMNVHVAGTIGERGPFGGGVVGIYASRNTGGTVDYGPRGEGVMGADNAIDFFFHRAEPSDKTHIWARYSFTGGGSWGIITPEGKVLRYHEPSLWEDADDEKRQARIDYEWARFRKTGYTGARLLIEQDILPQSLPDSIEGGPSTRAASP